MESTVAGAVELLAAAAQERGGAAGRRADGAFFTDADVARWMARRAIGAWLLDAIGEPAPAIDRLLADGNDPIFAACDAAARSSAARDAIRAAVVRVVVLDPTCGAGSFLDAARLALDEVADAVGADWSTSQLHGVDRSLDAIEACRATFDLLAPDREPPTLVHADALDPGVLVAADVVLGNPPFVRAPATDERAVEVRTAGAGNLAAWVVERALDAARPDARVAFVLPISVACTDAFAPARQHWSDSCDRVLASHFDTIPSTLFRGVVQRITILEGRRRAPGAADPTRWFTSRYHRWTRDERDDLLDTVRHVPLPPQHVGGSIAKVGTPLESALLERLFAHPPAGRWLAATGDGSNTVRYKRRWSYFLLFCDFVPGIWDADGTPREPTELKELHVAPAIDSRVLLAAYSSTLFWWYFSVFTDNRNVNRRDLAAFPVPDLSSPHVEQLCGLADELMDVLRDCAEVRTCTYRSVGTIRNTYFRQAATRVVLDRIDAVLAEAYGLDDEQLAFVLGFERRFRG